MQLGHVQLVRRLCRLPEQQEHLGCHVGRFRPLLKGRDQLTTGGAVEIAGVFGRSSVTVSMLLRQFTSWFPQFDGSPPHPGTRGQFPSMLPSHTGRTWTTQ